MSSRRSAPDPEFLRVAFLHPDLGLGGAERLVVDAAAELGARGHTVDVFTSHFDPSRCFDECRSGAFAVLVAGSGFPRSLSGGRFVAVCALARCCLAACALAWRARRGAARGGARALGAYDCVVVDQVAGVVPFLKLLLWLSARLLPSPSPPLSSRLPPPPDAAPPAPEDAAAARRRGGGGGGGKRGAAAAKTTARRSAPTTPVLFYCHFPDLLLSGGRHSALKRLYRAPLDALEQGATGSADAILVNSRFTAGVFAETFPRLARRGVCPRVLYPAAAVPEQQALLEAAGAWPGELALTAGQRAVVREAAAAAAAAAGGGGGGGAGTTATTAATTTPAKTAADADDLVAFLRGGPVVLSINRFERKKGLALGLQALRRVLDDLEAERRSRAARQQRRRQQQQQQGDGDGDNAAQQSDEAPSCARAALLPPPGSPRLVLAGGHDPRLPENAEHLRELMAEAGALGLAPHVRWLPSFSDRQRALLLAACRAVLYTPSGEHFGIVPLEAMASARPVICLASGGPLESVVDGETGFLCDPARGAEAVAAAWRAALQDGGAPAAAMGLAARRHVESCFSRRAFGDALERALRDLVEGARG